MRTFATSRRECIEGRECRARVARALAGYGTSVRCGGRLELRRGSVHEHAFWSVGELSSLLTVKTLTGMVVNLFVKLIARYASRSSSPHLRRTKTVTHRLSGCVVFTKTNLSLSLFGSGRRPGGRAGGGRARAGRAGSQSH